MLLGLQYQYKRLPFGIKPGPKTFQRYISEILKGITNCFVYIDDIVIYTKTIEEHKRILDIVLKRLLEHEVKINFEKSKIGMKEVEVLGYRVNNKEIFPIFTDKTSKLLNRNIKTRKEVQRLVGLLNWYRKFIPNLSERICEITNLLKGRKDDKKITVTRQIKDEINKLSKIIANESKLDFPDFSKKFTLECDAPDMGIGSVLRQEDKIIGYYFKKLQGPELNYSIVEKEYLSIFLVLLHFQRIIQGNYIEIYTDNRNCNHDNKKITSRIQRWKLLMNEFSYSIFHIQGKNNSVADELSRCFLLKTKNKKEEFNQLVNDVCQRERNKKIKID